MMNRRISIPVLMILLVAGAAAACSSGGLDPARQFDDAVVAANVRAALDADPSLAGHSVVVSVDRGVVTLRGSVRSSAQIDAAARAARSTQGVLSVRNEITVGR